MTKKAWIITIGDEILLGKVINWNAYWIAKRLSSVGVFVERIVCIPDDLISIQNTIKECLEASVDYVITTGGLGPTPGDITLEGIANALGRKLKLDERALEFIKKRYEELRELGLVSSDEINPSRKKMAYIPEGGEVVYNDVGVAPGVILKVGSTTIICLPGVPSEAMYLLEKIIPRVKTVRGLEIVEDYIDICDESHIARCLENIRNIFPGISIKTYPIGYGQRNIRVIAVGKEKHEVMKALTVLKECLGLL